MKIIIEVSGKEYKVTESEARHIYQQLEGLFKEKESTLFPYNPHEQFGPRPNFLVDNWKTTWSGDLDGWGR